MLKLIEFVCGMDGHKEEILTIHFLIFSQKTFDS